jgi:hypothetical protein
MHDGFSFLARGEVMEEREGKQKGACPRCGAQWDKAKGQHPVPSLRDNETDLCEDCAMLEAFEAAGFTRAYIGPVYWKVA